MRRDPTSSDLWRVPLEDIRDCWMMIITLALLVLDHAIPETQLGTSLKGPPQPPFWIQPRLGNAWPSHQLIRLHTKEALFIYDP